MSYKDLEKDYPYVSVKDTDKSKDSDIEESAGVSPSSSPMIEPDITIGTPVAPPNRIPERVSPRRNQDDFQPWKKMAAAMSAGVPPGTPASALEEHKDEKDMSAEEIITRRLHANERRRNHRSKCEQICEFLFGCLGACCRGCISGMTGNSRY
ncbi:unnamed protein product [Moneuplotes crassus]|uniref:Uncharacterized protein n=1 Tax=Euplotes crassus TaxID=5936 RepID=A0AAD2CWE9_EUPCR|nr:unnamed protein product [Moneuplotes crassus]